jgi:hypothetical protein
VTVLRLVVVLLLLMQVLLHLLLRCQVVLWEQQQQDLVVVVMVMVLLLQVRSGCQAERALPQYLCCRQEAELFGRHQQRQVLTLCRPQPHPAPGC